MFTSEIYPLLFTNQELVILLNNLFIEDFHFSKET